MHWTLFLTVQTLIWAVFATPWRPQALMLVLTWCAAQAWYFETGESVPRDFYIVTDIPVIAAFLLWRASWLDWLVLGLFPVEWWVYFQVDSETLAWWLLWILAGAQAIASGPWPVFIRPVSSYSHGSVKTVTAGARNGGL